MTVMQVSFGLFVDSSCDYVPALTEATTSMFSRSIYLAKRISRYILSTTLRAAKEGSSMAEVLSLSKTAFGVTCALRVQHI
jgi:hypothetical protein